MLRHLRCFVAVSEHLNFTVASNKLNVSQPSISQQIADLEKMLGFSLLKRNNRSVELTPAGAVFLKEAKGILQATEYAIAKATQTHLGKIGELRIGVLEPAVSSFLPEVILAFKKEYPLVTIAITHMNPQVQLQAFQSAQLDVGFSRPFRQEKYTNIQQEIIYVDKIVAVLPKDHPLAAQKIISIKELANDSFILFNRIEATRFFELMVSFCEDKGDFVPAVTQEPNLLQTLFLLVECGLGVSLVPACVRSLGNSNVQLIDLKEETPDIPLTISYLKDNSSPVTQRFLQIFKQYQDQSIKQTCI